MLIGAVVNAGSARICAPLKAVYVIDCHRGVQVLRLSGPHHANLAPRSKPGRWLQNVKHQSMLRTPPISKKSVKAQTLHPMSDRVEMLSPKAYAGTY